jgi:peptide deformylase
MAVRTILTLEHPALRRKAKRVKHFGDALQRLADDMVETMRAAPGIGLAATQLGIMERVITVELTKDEDDPQSGKLYVLVNPEFVKRSSEEEEREEGCLSIPGYVGDVRRPTWVTVKGQDLKGREVRVKAYDLLARAFQHEMDHLDGVLFIDRVDSPDKIRKVQPQEQEEEEMATA